MPRNKQGEICCGKRGTIVTPRQKFTPNIPAGGGGGGGGAADGSYRRGSFTIATGQYSIMSRRLELIGTQRGRGVGTAALRIT